jgi:hypothetical protein
MVKKKVDKADLLPTNATEMDGQEGDGVAMYSVEHLQQQLQGQNQQQHPLQPQQQQQPPMPVEPRGMVYVEMKDKCLPPPKAALPERMQVEVPQQAQVQMYGQQQQQQAQQQLLQQMQGPFPKAPVAKVKAQKQEIGPYMGGGLAPPRGLMGIMEMPLGGPPPLPPILPQPKVGPQPQQLLQHAWEMPSLTASQQQVIRVALNKAVVPKGKAKGQAGGKGHHRGTGVGNPFAKHKGWSRGEWATFYSKQSALWWKKQARRIFDQQEDRLGNVAMVERFTLTEWEEHMYEYSPNDWADWYCDHCPDPE